jgi:hypothetical protein
MLVVLTQEQILTPHKVCCGCLLADRSGLPRWRKGKLVCARALQEMKMTPAEAPRTTDQPPELYECQMGFRLANIEG